jgi:hypothetical protein
MFSRDLDSVLVECYEDGLADLAEEHLTGVFTKALLECKFMPTVAELRGFITNREEAVDALKADREWKRILDHVDYNIAAYEHKAPADLSPTGDYALRQIGGIEAVYNLMLENNEEQLRWLGKDFREHYARYSETGGLKAIGRDEARRLLDQTMAWRKELPEAKQ